jgi:hypothetical protein
MLTGDDPGETPFKFSFAQRATGVTIPPDLEDLILRMVEMDASKRPASARAVKEELQRISMQHLRRLYPLPGPTPSAPSYQSPFPQGQPPPAAWATAAPSLRQAQMQLGLPPTPLAPKRKVSRRAVTTMILLGIAGAAIVENSRWIWSQPDASYPQPDQMPVYSLTQLSTYNGHSGSVTSLAWSDQASVVASGSKDGTLKVWSPFSYQTYATHKINHAQVNGVAWSPGGSYVAATTSDKSHPVAIWGNSGLSDPASSTYTGPALSAMNSIAWSPQNSLLAIGGNDRIVRVLEPRGPTLTHATSYIGHSDVVHSLAWIWSDAGSYLASASADKTVRVWPVTQNGSATVRDTEYVFKGHTDSVNAVAWASLGGKDYVISGSSDMTIQVWVAFDGNIVSTYSLPSAVQAIAWSSGWSATNSFFAAGLADGSIYLYQAFETEPLYVFQGNGKAIRSLSWSPDGTSLISGGDDNSVTVWRLDETQINTYHRHWHQ